MSTNKKKYRRLSGKQSIKAFSIKNPSSYQDHYFYSDRCTGDFERNGEVSINYKISVENNVCLRNHRVFGQFIFPTDAYLEILVVACRSYFSIDVMMFENIVIVNPLIGNAESTNNMTLVFQKNGENLRFTVKSHGGDKYDGSRDKIHMRGTVRPVEKQGNRVKHPPDLSIEKSIPFPVDKFYSKDATIILGEFYHSLKSLDFGQKQSIGKIEVDREDNRFLLHPSVVSAALANAMSYGPYRLSDIHHIGSDIFLPYKIDGLTVFGQTGGRHFISLSEVKEVNEGWIDLSLEIINENNNVIVSIETLRLQRTTSDRYQVLAKKQGINEKSTVPLSTETESINENDDCMDIAIIGMSCRFPMSNTVEEFWEVLKNGSDCITEVPKDRWQEFDYWYNPDPDHQQTAYSKWGGFIDDVDKFDPLFFNISPSEAELMDPQQRIFLEESWRAIESAGYSPGALNNQKCGVFVGCTTGDYDRVLALSEEDTNGQVFMGTSSAILAARIAYILNLKGPSLAVDTACSSSLTAVHLACMSIRNGESDLAIAGGISIFSTPLSHILTSRVRMQSIDGRCFTFDKSANGTVFSEGCGIVMLKPLAQAEQDRDPIMGVIKGSGINQDGKTNGITAPSAKSQESLLRSIYKKYAIDPANITYVEAHGTATPLGDPIEFQALTNAFQSSSGRKQYCALGSVKSNIGHGSYAAGIAGLIKTVLCLKHNKYVPTAHFKEANSIMDLERSPFFISTNYDHWGEPECGKRVAAISSFGFSGANAHLVLEEYQSELGFYEYYNIKPAIIPLSAKNKDRLIDMVSNLSAYLKRGGSGSHPDTPKLAEISYTLQMGRDNMNERVVFVVDSVSGLLKKLDKFSEKKGSIEGCYQGNAKNNKTALCFGEEDTTEEQLAFWMREGKTEKYLAMWVNGMSVDWHVLYDGKCPNKVSLPAYPFAKERYWVSPRVTRKNNTPFNKESRSSAIIHPLVQINASDLFSQTYCSIFDGSEYFFSRNSSSQISTMADFVFLEMARVAIMAALGDAYKHIHINLNNTKWFSVVSVKNDPVRLSIDLYDTELGVNNEFVSINYSIYSIQHDIHEKIIHVQGEASFNDQSQTENINITGLLEKSDGPIFDSTQCDELYDLLNLECVPSVLGIQRIISCEGQAVIQHCLPDDLIADNSEPVLHPALLILVCKTAAAIVKGISNLGKDRSKKYTENNQSDDLFLMADAHSVSVEKIEIFSLPEKNMYAWIRYAKCGSSRGNTYKMDVSLCDEQGHVCVKITGYEISIYLSDSHNNYNLDASLKKSLSVLSKKEDNRHPDVSNNRLAHPDISPIKYGGTYLLVCECEEIGGLLVDYLSRSDAAKLIIIILSTSISSLKKKLKMIKEVNSDIHYVSVDSLQPSVVEKVLKDTNIQNDKIKGIFYVGKISDPLFNRENRKDSGSPWISDALDGLSITPDFICHFLSDKNMVRRQLMEGDHHDICRVAQVDNLDEFQDKEITCGRLVVIDRLTGNANRFDSSVSEAENKNDELACADIDFIENVFYQALVQDNKSTFTVIDQGSSSSGYRFLYKLPMVDDQSLKNEVFKCDNKPDIPGIETYICNDLKKIINEQLKINQALLEVDTNFSEFGYDSILLTEFSHRLSQHFDIEISPAVLFGNYTLDKLTAYLLSDAGESIVQYYTKRHSADNRINIRKTSGKAPLYHQRNFIAGNKDSLINHQERSVKNSENRKSQERIAVIGMSGKLPMADDLDEFWRNLMSGKDCISRIPADRGSVKTEADATAHCETYAPRGGVINGIAEFDPDFFGISDREAELMDPNQRLIMMYVYRAIEDAGYSPESLSGKNIAVFMGTANSGYDRLVEKSGGEIEAFTATGVQPSVGPNRISYYLDLRGPSEPIETACASSLVAIRRGIAALNDGCEMAIVGGVNTLLRPTEHIAYDKAGMLSKDGRCKTFSSHADGFVRSEGIGVLILKKLGNAENEGDSVYGVICGSAENHGGRAHSLTTPNPVAQAQLLEKAYQEANVDPRTVTYLEAHGTGTELGDSIEIDALKMAFKSLITQSLHEGDSNDERVPLAIENYCGLGSVKTNIGHTELASGVVGVIKVLLQLKHKMLVKNLNSHPLNPYLQLDGSPFFVVQNTQKWQALSDGFSYPIPRRAGVSSFGMGGVNAHVILEEYISQQENVSDAETTQLVVFSAKNKKQLEAVVQQMLDYVRVNETLSLSRFAYTLQVGRDQMNIRLAMIVSDREMLITSMTHFLHMRDVMHSSVLPVYSGEGKNEVPDHHLIHQFVQDKNLEEMGQCWVRGGKIPWDLLHKGNVVRKLSLPVYPFDNQQYWVSEMTGSSQDVMATPDMKDARLKDNTLTHINQISRSPLFDNWFLYG